MLFMVRWAGERIMAKRKDPRDIVQFKIRTTQGLKEQLERAAAAHQWSFNAEVNRRLGDSFEGEREAALMEMFEAERRRADALEYLRLRAIRSGNIDDLIPPPEDKRGKE
jgi:hypothetical protein